MQKKALCKRDLFFSFEINIQAILIFEELLWAYLKL